MRGAASPTGTVTFLFTDIEGSTKLWESYPEQMRGALARHDALMREAISRANGYVFKTVGDAFCAAFATSSEAVSAALEAQLALHLEPWPDQTPIYVRMGLHTGLAESRDADYFGPPVNRVARLLATAHGGQTLLSQPTCDLVRDFLPEGASLRDLGVHRLRDFEEPDHVYQLQHPALPDGFPPIRSLSTHPNNLPEQLTNFIGRERELSDIGELITKTRLLTMTGSGGCGKTRLGLQVAAKTLERFPGGTWFVELAPVADPRQVPQTVANVLSLKEEPGKPHIETLTHHLRNRRLLLLIDNCEHLVDACATLVHELVRQCPGVQVLATSREALGIAGERAYRVPSLSLPDERVNPTPENLSSYESVRLFVDRADLHQQGFAVTNKNARTLASICCRLDGIPLAIELAAARVRSLSVEEIDGRLDQRFRLLTGGSRAALPRHRTLRSLIDWSYDLLNESEKALLRRLSVFTGGSTLEAAEQVCAEEGADDWETLELLTSLADKSLVVAELKDRQVRYRMLETIRQYGRERLAETGESDGVQGRHLAYFLSLAEEAEPHLAGAGQVEWLARLDREHDNLQAALAWSQVEEGGAVAGLRLAGALWRFWMVRSHLGPGRVYLGEALAGESSTRWTLFRARALHGAGVLAYLQGDYGSATALHEESLSITRQLGDKSGIASSLMNLGNLAWSQGAYDAATALYEESLSIKRELGDKHGIASSLENLGNVANRQGDSALAKARYQESLSIRTELGDKHGMGMSLGNLGNVAAEQGDYGVARALYEESLTIRRELGDKHGIAYSLLGLGSVAFEQGDYARAGTLQEEGLSIRRELGDKHGTAYALQGLGSVAFEQGDYGRARALQEESLSIWRELGDRYNIAFSLGSLAAVIGSEGHPQQATLLLGAATALREDIGSPLTSTERGRFDRQMLGALEALGEEAFTAAWASGRALTIEQAIELAMDEISR